ncbi:MAG TPA: tRNA (adenosine(37)-N6)-dimethylallyltransferase MiaA, partial [Rhodothermales bacterium]|nr:tRNA (adenosine(37)-N6)-dimethylallyltransferase MiaA [Rhodothermales bacterium]
MSSFTPVLAGPTGVGKTELSLYLAKELHAEIISADSRQIYRELTVGTAKPTHAELEEVPHHFIDELSLGEGFSAGAFARAATVRIQEIRERGRIPLVVGGSTLYLHALQGGLADIPTVEADIRAELQNRLVTEGSERLHAELRRVDPVSAASMDASKSQRIVRALEVYYGTGKPLSHYFAVAPLPATRFRTFVLNRDRSELYERIDARVDAMLEGGLLEEVQNLLTQGFSPNLNALRTIGYAEPIRYLRGEISRAEMVRLLKRNSRRYAKRQLTWFR